MKRTLFLIPAVAAIAAVLLFSGCAKGQIMDDPGMVNLPTGEPSAVLQFHSFDGGGPSYSVRFDDDSLVRCLESTRYNDPNHAELDGAGYDVLFEFYGRQAGQTQMTLSARSPIGGDYDTVYLVTVDEALKVTLEELYTEDLSEGSHVDRPLLTLAFGDRSAYANLDDTEAAGKLIDLLYSTNYGLYYRDYQGFAVSAVLDAELPLSDETFDAAPGDVVLLRGEGDEEGELLFCIIYREQTVTGTRVASALGFDTADWQEIFEAAPHEGDYICGEIWTEYSE